MNKLTLITKNVKKVGSKWHSLFLCECGNEVTKDNFRVNSGKTKSCGCLRTKTNPHYKNTAYSPWISMKSRCYTKSTTGYENYGARGITVSDEWINSFETFLVDMGERPTLDHSIDRIDVNKGYSKENCKWSTKSEQESNRRIKSNTGYMGVTETVNGRFECAITKDKKRIFREMHGTVEEAVRARNKFITDNGLTNPLNKL